MGGGHLIFGIEQDAYGDMFMVKQSLCGDLIDTKLFSSLLSVDQMLDFIHCRPMTGVPKPVVDFTNLDLFNHGGAVSASLTSRNSICNRQNFSFTLLFPEKRVFDESARLCHASGGTLALPKNHQENLDLVNLTSRYERECHDDFFDSTWLGVRADLTTNTWVHYLTGQQATYE